MDSQFDPKSSDSWSIADLDILIAHCDSPGFALHMKFFETTENTWREILYSYRSDFPLTQFARGRLSILEEMRAMRAKLVAHRAALLEKRKGQ